MSKRLARSMARLVGAPTPAITPIFAINPFCTNSKFNLPEHAMNCFCGFNRLLVIIYRKNYTLKDNRKSVFPIELCS